MGTSNTPISSVYRVKVMMRRNRSGFFGAAKRNIVKVRGTVVFLAGAACLSTLISEKFRVRAAGLRKLFEGAANHR